MTAEQAFELMVRRLMQGVKIGSGISIHIGKVKEIDEKEDTCTVDMDGLQMHDVRIHAIIDEQVTDKCTVYPAMDSYVMVLGMGDCEGMILATSTIAKVNIKTGDVSAEVSKDGVTLNGGALGGMVKVNELTDKINELVKAFNNHTHQVSTTGTAAAQSGSAVAIQNKASMLKGTDYEDDKVKH